MSRNKDQPKKQHNVLIIGHSPLPFENTQKTFAPGIRTWHFSKSAKEANCNVLVIGARIPKAYGEKLPDILKKEIEGITYYSVEPFIFENKQWLEEKIRDFDPTCIVGVNSYPSSIVSGLEISVPFWADLNGGVMAEAQAKAYVYNDNTYLAHFFKIESKILGKADVFSVVSESQGFSLIGELGIWGRLNKETMGYRFVRVMPNALEKKSLTHRKKVIRGIKAKDNDFVVLYSGGYNTWTDVKTLFRGLEKAMSKNSKIVFVSTGGQIEGHDEITYQQFQEMISTSKYKDRFHLCGWVPTQDLPNYYLEANIGINSDKYCYESILGARTRILDWLQVPLTFISSPLSEVTDYLIKNDLAYGFKEGDDEELSEILVKLANNPTEIEIKKESIQKVVNEEFTIQKIHSEFKEWIKNPAHSPDYGLNSPLIEASKENILVKIPVKQQLAIFSWSKISKILRFLKLERYEEKIKKTGENLVVKKPETFKAKILESKIPKLSKNKKYLVSISVKNIGTATWYTHLEDPNPVNFSYVWKDVDGEKIILKNEERTPLPHSVKTNETINMDVMITSPNQTGDFLLEFDFVKENEFWFSERTSITYKKIIKVNDEKKNDIRNLPLVSIIVVTYNSGKFIDKCIQSILKNDYSSYEIIVIDNASSDNTLDVLQKYSKNIQLIKNKSNLGFTQANNLGIKNSKGEIIFLLNPDAYIVEDSILELVLPFLEDPQIMVTGSKVLYPETDIIQSAGGIIQKNGLTNHIGYKEPDRLQYDFPRSVDYVTGASMAVRRSFFEQAGLFDPVYFPAYYEETDRCVKAKKLGYKILYSPKSKVFHYESTTLGALSENYLKMFHKNRFKFIYRNFGLRKFLREFLPAEIKWFLVHCPNREKKIVIKAHLSIIFSGKTYSSKIEKLV